MGISIRTPTARTALGYREQLETSWVKHIYDRGALRREFSKVTIFVQAGSLTKNHRGFIAAG